MKVINCLLLLNIFLFNHTYAQDVFYQDIFYGGVTGAGFSSCQGAGAGNINIYTEPGSSIKKAFLFSYKIGNSSNYNGIKFNGNNINFNSFTQFTPNINNFLMGAPFYSIHYIDVTSLVSINQTSYPVEIPPQLSNLTECPNCVYGALFLYVQYENNLLNKTSTSIIINKNDNADITQITTNNLTPINTFNDVGFSIYSDRIKSYQQNDGTYIHINNNNLGLLGGEDLVNSGFECGVKGHFYYQNGTLVGLDDDVANNSFNGSDGIANISNLLNQFQTNLQVKFELQSPNSSHSHSNFHLAYFLNHSTPCDTFTTTLTPDTTICFGETLQLQATGGQSYEWSALSDSSAITDLSCTDCPNPIFSGDSSQVYTVRIWNTDSCSVVKPISIGVSHPSEIISSTFNSVCSFSTGKIKMQNVPNNVVQFGAVNKNGDTLTANSANTFNGLSAGDYTLFYIDKFGCSTDTVVTIIPVIDTKAAFATNPISGTAPIQINLQNNSVNATDYSWSLNGDYQGNQFSGFWTDTSGTYEIELIAWKTDSICADTVSFTVFIFDSLVASLPNVFTPNNDGVNDFFNVKVNLPVSYKLSILNRWGNVVFENEGDLTKGEHKLWNGESKSGEIVTDGTYFYKMVFGLDRESIDCEITECEVVKQGFVQVINK
jgi:gliding motility-associated-like protein